MLHAEYYKWKTAVDKARIEYEKNPCQDTHDELERATHWYRDTCTKILEQLMVYNADILKRLKEC
jgi:hypothetical protein